MKTILIYSFLAIFFLWIFKSWFLSPILAFGDNWFYFPSMYSNHFLRPFAWYTHALSTGLGGQGFPYINTYIFVALILNIVKLTHLSWEITSKILLYITYIILSFSAIVFFVKKMFPENKFWFLAPIIFVANTYILMVAGGGQIITALSYSLIPFTLYFFIKLLDTQKKWNFNLLTVSVVFLFLQCILDLRIALVTSILILIYFLVSLISGKVSLGSFARIILAFGLIALLSAYWLIPIAFYGIDPIKQLGVDYSSSSIVKFLSFANFENSISLLHPYWPENIFGKIGFMKPEFLLLPIFAFLPILSIKKISNKRLLLFFLLSALVGIFLAKGANAPFGNIYLLLFNHVPGFQLFRDSFKWYSIIAFSYALLIPIAAEQIYNWIEQEDRLRFLTKSDLFNLQNLFIAAVTVYLLFLIRPALLGQLGGTFKTRDIPQEYAALNEFLSSQNGFFRTFWAPSTTLFGYYSNNHPEISGRDLLREYDQTKLLNKLSAEPSQRLLNEAGVEYVIVPQDSEKEIFLTDRKFDRKKYLNFVAQLNELPNLKKIRTFGDIVVYQTDSYKDRFWCNCGASFAYKFIDPTHYIVDVKNTEKGDQIIFSEAYDKGWVARVNGQTILSKPYNEFNSFVIPDNTKTLDFYYSPQDLVSLGLKISLLTFVILILVTVLYNLSSFGNLAIKLRK